MVTRPPSPSSEPAPTAGPVLHRGADATEQAREVAEQAREQADAQPPAESELLGHLHQYTQAPLQEILDVLDHLETTPLTVAQRRGVQSARASAQHLFDLFADPMRASIPASDTRLPAADATPAALDDAPPLDVPKPVGLDLIDTASYTSVASMMAPDKLEEWLASLFDPPAAAKQVLSPVARRKDQAEWQDPASGYVRRNVSPAGWPMPA